MTIGADSVVREVIVEASAETIFPFFTDPEKMTRWMGQAALLDPRSGGVFRVDMNGTDVIRGTYVELEPPSRLVFTFGWEGADASHGPGESTVEVTLAPHDGATLVRLVHTGLPPEVARGHDEGWGMFLPRLVEAAAAAS